MLKQNQRSNQDRSPGQADVLLVDDDPSNLLALRSVLETLGENLVEVDSGAAALQQVQEKDFAVILLDVQLPGLSGFETARKLRGLERSKHTPIIFITGFDQGFSIEEAYSLGAVDYLVKPVAPVMLTAKVRNFVDLFHEQQKAKAEADQLRMLIHGTSEYAIFLLDAGGHVATWNPGAERLKGYKADEIIGHHFSRFYPQEAVDRGWPEHELEVARTTGRFEDEGWRIRKDGSQFWANVVITALFDKNRQLRGFSKITRDMTERKAAEENAKRLVQEETARKVAEENAKAIQQEREKLRVTLMSIGDAVIGTDLLGKITFLNPVAEKLTGWPAAEACGQPLVDVFRIVNEETRRTVENPATRALREGVIVALANHTLLISRDDTERPIDDSAAPILDTEGGVNGVVLIFRDVTERRWTEHSLKFLADASTRLAVLTEFQQTLEMIAGLAVPKFADWCSVDIVQTDSTLRSVAVVHTDPSKVKLAEEFRRRYPPAADSLHGMPQVVRTAQSDMMSDITEDLLVKGARDEGELAMLRELGFRSYMCVPLKSRENVIGVISFVFAESGRRYTQADLAFAEELARRASIAIENAQLYAELRDRDRRKDEFLATLAHELRNPLAPIRNGLEVLGMPRVDAETSSNIRSIMERQLNHIVRLVDDLLDASRVMRGKIELRRTPVEVSEVIARAIETANPLIAPQEHELTINVPSESLVIDADPVRLTQVIGNLLNNAAKYTQKQGHIWLTANRKNSDVVITVRDNGIGIEPDTLPHIFELFVQGETATTRSQGGLGIGLTLVKSLVEMHGGQIDVRSPGLGKGTEFTLKLPLATSVMIPQPAAPSAAVPAGTGRRLLVVDDNHDAANSLATFLRLRGHQVRTAHDGITAIEMAKEYLPDMIFLDIGMPGMDGYQVARRIRDDADLKHTMLTAVTGWGQEEDRRRSAEAGFNHHVVKPPQGAEIEGLLERMNE